MEERASLQERKLARSQDFRQRHYVLQKQAWMKQVLKVSCAVGRLGQFIAEVEAKKSQWWTKVVWVVNL